MSSANAQDLEEFRNSIRSFCRREVTLELVRRMDREDFIPPDLIRRLGELGYMGVAFPEEYGGGGGGIHELVVLGEELSAVSSAISGIVISTAVFGGLNILLSGSDAQRSELLPKVCSGELLSAMAITEADAGSDVSAVSTKAERMDGGWVLNGTKMFTSGAQEAQLVMIVARTGSGPRRHDGLTVFLVPNPTAGLEIRKLEKIGNRGITTCELVLDDVRLPHDAVLGGAEAAGEGWAQAMKTFEVERITMAAMSVGIARRALKDAVAYAGERHQFGQAIGNFQAVGHSLAEMATQVEAASALVATAANRFADGLPCATEAAMAKLFATERAKEICLGGMQVLGGYGYLPEFDMERHLRDALLGTVGAGTSQIQRTIIARSMGFRT
ncbi:acyl-CoA dehydrogenase family protein [Pseudonocardia sp. RS010]|uniref:acyl-CoA dehydrogenase family protein n=1 Tax=Pseudonocardia sp. RS010 TaxID=3385979 RepID=UPI00399F5FE9